MDNISGIPNTLKQVNLSAVRRVIREKGSVTRSEIVQETGISVTTVRALLTEMIENEEITVAGYDASIGGRRAVRYQLNKDRFFGAALCLEEGKVRWLVVNICGEIIESGSFPAKGDVSGPICSFLDGLFARLDIKSIGVGVPGIVHGLEYRRINSDGVLESHPIGKLLKQRYGVPVLLENDLNAITLGFGLCYQKQYPKESSENIHMAYLSFSRDCLSAGFLSGGRLLRGYNNFVGELGLFPAGDAGSLDDLLASPLDDKEYSGLVAKLIAGVCCILNPRYVAVGGPAFRTDCLPAIVEAFSDTLPDKMAAEIISANDPWNDYSIGMAYLTAEQIFSSVLLIKG